MIDVVVVYDRQLAKVVDCVIFTESPREAFAKRLELERANRDRGNVEVVLLSAKKLDDLKVSHSRYFDPDAISAGRLSKELSRRIAS